MVFILFFLGSSIALQAGRASIIAAFLAMDFAALPTLYGFGLFTREAVMLALVSLPALVVGVFLGSRLVGRVEERAARRAVLLLLMGMAVAIGARSLLGAAGP